MILGLGLAAISCDLFKSMEDRTEDMVHEKMSTIDLNEVDGYPYFEACDENASKAVQRECFQTVMLSYFSKALDDLQFQVNKDLNDTIYVDFIIDEHGFITVREVEENSKVLGEIENFNELVTERLNEITTVSPAHKRGIDVGMRIRLPLVLNTQN